MPHSKATSSTRWARWCKIPGIHTLLDSYYLMEKLTITQVDCDIITFVGRERKSAAEIATATDAQLTNTHNKLTKLCARGLMSDTFRKDKNRAGLHAGEQRRVYGSTALGRTALLLYKGVAESLAKTGASHKPGRRTAAKKTSSKRSSSKRSSSASTNG